LEAGNEQPDGCHVLLSAWMTESVVGTLPIVDVPRLSLFSEKSRTSLVKRLRAMTTRTLRATGLTTAIEAAANPRAPAEPSGFHSSRVRITPAMSPTPLSIGELQNKIDFFVPRPPRREPAQLGLHSCSCDHHKH